LVVALAGAAGIAIENARLHARVRELALLQDRERIARDLHDTVIQRLFATGLSLQGAARLANRPEVVERIENAVEDLDDPARHAAATRVDVEVSAGDDVVLVVRDDGRGFSGSSDGPDHGLRNMRSRAEKLGGRLQVTAAGNRGTRLEWRIPAKSPAA